MHWQYVCLGSRIRGAIKPNTNRHKWPACQKSKTLPKCSISISHTPAYTRIHTHTYTIVCACEFWFANFLLTICNFWRRKRSFHSWLFYCCYCFWYFLLFFCILTKRFHISARLENYAALLVACQAHDRPTVAEPQPEPEPRRRPKCFGKLILNFSLLHLARKFVATNAPTHTLNIWPGGFSQLFKGQPLPVY